MKKNIVIIVLSCLLIALGGYLVCDKFLTKEVNTKEEENKEQKENLEIKAYSYYTEESGEYILKLNTETKTYEMQLNACSGILDINGSYEINNDKLILKEIKHDSDDSFVLPSTVEFIIENDNKMVLNQDFSCIVKGQVFNSKELLVVDYINYSIDKTGKVGNCDHENIEKIKIPMLDSNKKGAIELNNKIQEDLKIYIDATKRSDEETLNSNMGYKANYFYEEHGKYLSLRIDVSSIRYCGTGSSYSYLYTYDKEEDNYLTNDELLSLANLSKEDLIKTVKTDISSKNYSNEEVNDYINIATDNINNNTYDAYINSLGQLIIEIEYQFGSMPTIYTYEI